MTTTDGKVPGFRDPLRGFRPEPPDPRHWKLDRIGRNHDWRNIDWRRLSPTERRHDQAGTNSCVANAVVRGLELALAIRGRSSPDLSRLAVYWLARELMDPQETDRDEGTYISHACDALRRFGACPEDDWPFDPDRVLDAPSWRAMRRAHNHRLAAFHRIKATGRRRAEVVREALRNGMPVAFGTRVDGSWTTYHGTGTLGPVRSGPGSHAMLIVGSIEDGRFAIENSWGPEWGVDGFAVVSERVITSSASRDFWALDVGP